MWAKGLIDLVKNEMLQSTKHQNSNKKPVDKHLFDTYNDCRTAYLLIRMCLSYNDCISGKSFAEDNIYG